MNPATRYGYIKAAIKPEDYIFGSGQIPGEILQPYGQWGAFLPPDEFQNRNGVEPYACATFGTLNALEIILRRLYGADVNFSDRFTAQISGTQYQHGNSPHTVAEYIRKIGAVPEEAWPITPDVDTFEKWYAEPGKSLYDRARRFLSEYDFRHDWLPDTKPDTLKEALKHSPVGASAFAWAAGHDGRFYKPTGTSDNHWCAITGYEEGVCWKVFDSYDNTHKELVWDFAFEQAKRYVIRKKAPTENENLFLRLVNAILAVFTDTKLSLTQKEAVVTEIAKTAVPAPNIPSMPPLPHLSPNTAPAQPSEPTALSPFPPMIPRWAKAVQKAEGWAPNLPSYRNNNPGNLKYSTLTKSLGAVPGSPAADDGSFARFATYDQGFDALCEFLLLGAQDKLRDFHQARTVRLFSRVYGNPPNDGYGLAIAKDLGVPVDTPISSFLI